MAMPCIPQINPPFPNMQQPMNQFPLNQQITPPYPVSNLNIGLPPMQPMPLNPQFPPLNPQPFMPASQPQVLNYPDGTRYHGQVIMDNQGVQKPHGQGTIWLASGNIYVGEFQWGRRH